MSTLFFVLILLSILVICILLPLFLQYKDRNKPNPYTDPSNPFITERSTEETPEKLERMKLFAKQTSIFEKPKYLLTLFYVHAFLFILFVWILVLLSAIEYGSFDFPMTRAITYTFVMVFIGFGARFVRIFKQLYLFLPIICTLNVLLATLFAISFITSDGPRGGTISWIEALYKMCLLLVPVVIGLGLWKALVLIDLIISFEIWNNRKLLSHINNQEDDSVEVPNREKTTIKAVATITPLLESILTKDIAVVRTALQEHPEQLNTAYAKNGNTPLHVAALNGYTEIVKLLLAQPGIDKTRKNNDGKTALDLAREKGFAEIVQMLEK